MQRTHRHPAFSLPLLASPFVSASTSASTLTKLCRRHTSKNTRLRVYAISTERQQRAITPETTSTPSSPGGHPTPDGSDETEQETQRMFSNLDPSSDGSLKRRPPSELACTALVAGTMIGAGVLALPTVAAPSGFIPSTTTLLGVWAYMSVTGLLLSEVTINTACALGRAEGVSMLSLGRLTLGKFGGVVTAAFYVLLHYAILTAYTAQGGQILLNHSIPILSDLFHSISSSSSSALLAGGVFAAMIGLPMILLPSRTLEKVNNVAVGSAVLAFFSIVSTNVSSSFASFASSSSAAAASHWDSIGIMVPVAFVSCVYHNIVSTITMRLEGDRAKITRAIIFGSGLPILMFILYDFVMLSSSSSASAAPVDTTWFSVLAIATSFVGFVEGLTELCADVRQTVGRGWQNTGRLPDFLVTLLPPVALAATSPDVFFKALDVAGTYGIAVLFGLLPAAMAWKNRIADKTKDFDKLVVGGNPLLLGVAAVPFALIVSRVWETLHHHV